MSEITLIVENVEMFRDGDTIIRHFNMYIYFMGYGNNTFHIVSWDILEYVTINIDQHWEMADHLRPPEEELNRTSNLSIDFGVKGWRVLRGSIFFSFFSGILQKID
jgi:hypothetical protein